MTTRLAAFAAIAAAAASAALTLAPAQAATTPDTRVHGQQVLCGARDQELTGAGLLVRNNIYQPGVVQCVRLRPYGFTITRSLRQGTGLVGSFPDVTYGCDMWGSCSRRSALPVLVSSLTDLMVTVRTRFSLHKGQAATDTSDIWFTNGQPAGPAGNRAELLIVIKRQNVPFPVEATVHACHRPWALDWWVTRNGGYSWNLLRARPLHGHLTSLHNCRLGPIIRFYERRHLIRQAWTLMSADWGFECWQGCRGDAVTGWWPTVMQLPVIGKLGPPHDLSQPRRGAA
jgi:Glycosyl hydrolase family 12